MTRSEATSRIQSLNRYAYALNNPTTLTDPTGLDDCAKAADPRACRLESYWGLGNSINPSFGSWDDPFRWIGIPVVTESFLPPQLLSTIDFGAMANANGYATSVSLFAPGGWTTTYVGDAFTFFGGWAENASFLKDFLTGTSATDRYYGPYSPQTQTLMNLQAAQQMVASNQSQGCPSVANFNRTTSQAAEQILTNFGNPTQIQIGAFHAAVTNYNGLATYTVINTASMSSFLYHLTPASANHNSGPLGNIYQVFYWSAASPCN